MKKITSILIVFLIAFCVHAVWWHQVEQRLTETMQRLLLSVDEIASPRLLLETGSISVTGYPFAHQVAVKDTQVTLNPMDDSATKIRAEGDVRLSTSNNRYTIAIKLPKKLSLIYDDNAAEILFPNYAEVLLTLRKPLGEGTDSLSPEALFSLAFTTERGQFSDPDVNTLSTFGPVEFNNRFILHDEGTLEKTLLSFFVKEFRNIVAKTPESTGSDLTDTEPEDNFYSKIGAFDYNGEMTFLRKQNPTTLDATWHVKIDNMKAENPEFDVALDGNLRLTSYGVMLPTGQVRLNFSNTETIIRLYAEYAAQLAAERGMQLPGGSKQAYAEKLTLFLKSVGSFYHEDDIMITLSHVGPGNMHINSKPLSEVMQTYARIMRGQS